jgi:uncharacterized protein (DUF1697 family)
VTGEASPTPTSAKAHEAHDGVHVALLRGVNVAGRTMVAMSALKAMFEAAGARYVGTWIQSGNVLFRARRQEAREITAKVEAAIADRLGLEVAVLLRTEGELDRVTRRNPFVRRGDDPKGLHVIFLDGRPAAERIATLDPRRSPPDEFVVADREIYLRCPNGVARSRLTIAWVEGGLAMKATMRNWRTVLKLAALAGEGQPFPGPSIRKR